MVHAQSLVSELQPSPLDAAVAKAVEAARANGSILRLGDVTRQIRSQAPDCPLPSRLVADLVARKAILIGVPIQFTPLD